jgi:hypothetical protein
MKLLLVHPEDHPCDGEWAHAHWDLIVDLAFASPAVYRDWSARLGTRVISLHQFARELDCYRWVNDVLQTARGQLLDRLGLDWWDIISVYYYQRLLQLYLVNELCAEIGDREVEWFGTRPHFCADLVQQVRRCESVRVLQGSQTRLTRAALKLSRVRKLRLPQIFEIVADKWDATYSIRRRMSSPINCKDPVVLLPSAYSNVTRVVLQYALQLPSLRFLLATTRASALPAHLPGNVSATSLAAYMAPRHQTQSEVDVMIRRWNAFGSVMKRSEALSCAERAGIFDSFASHLANGLGIRDAWLSLMRRELVEAVLCGDDLNYYTRLPLMIARKIGIKALYCYHGALDGGMLFKQPCADIHLVRGEMERDYLRHACATQANRIELAAPGHRPMPSSIRKEEGKLVFFSEPYENSGGRADEIYRELLPKLCGVASRVQRKVLIKLHPFESEKARRRLVRSSLSSSHRNLIEIVSDVPVEQIIAQAWCGVGVASSVAVECTLGGVPYFLCGWLDCNGFGYARQLANFSAGRLLECAEDLESIPELVAGDGVADAGENLWSEAGPERLEALFARHSRQTAAKQCAC